MTQLAGALRELRDALGAPANARSLLVKRCQPETGLPVLPVARTPIQRGRPSEVLLRGSPRFVQRSQVKAAGCLALVASVREVHNGKRIVTGDAGSRRVQAAKAHTSCRGVRIAGALEERGGACEILCHAFASGVQRAELRAPGDISPVARLLKERSCPRDVARRSGAAHVQDAEPRTALHATPLTPLTEECGGARGVPIDAGAALVHRAKPRATLTNPGLAGLLVQRRGAGQVAKDVFPLLELCRELVARSGVPRLAGVAQLPGFRVAGMAPREREARAGEEEETPCDPAQGRDGYSL